MPALGKEKLGKSETNKGDALWSYSEMGKLSFTVPQEEMAGPDSEVNRALQARSRLWWMMAPFSQWKGSPEGFGKSEQTLE